MNTVDMKNMNHKNNRNNRKNMPLLRMLFLLFCIGILAAGCGAKPQKKVGIYELQKAMVEADELLPEMMTVNSSDTDAADNFSYLSDLEYEKVDAYFLAYSAEGLADEIAVIRVKEEKDVAEAKKTLEDHKADRISIYQTYEPEQMARVEDAMIFTKGKYAVLIISDQSQKIKKAFDDQL